MMMLKNESKELSTLLGSVMNSEFFSKLTYVLILDFVNCLTGGIGREAEGVIVESDIISGKWSLKCSVSTAVKQSALGVDPKI